MRLMLDNPDLRAVPGNLRHLGGQAGNEAEQVQRCLLGDAEPAADRRPERGEGRGRCRQPQVTSTVRANVLASVA
jgi:hypothetical protein